MNSNQILLALVAVLTFLMEHRVSGGKHVNYNLLFDMMYKYGLKRCTSYEVAESTGGHELIHIDSISKGLSYETGYLSFEFYVLTTGEAHIHFTPDNARYWARNDYIIVLGCTGNIASRIVRWQASRHIQLTYSHFVTKKRGYKVRIVLDTEKTQARHRTISVFVDEKRELYVVDRQPIRSNRYISFSTLPTFWATFLFDCTTEQNSWRARDFSTNNTRIA